MFLYVFIGPSFCEAYGGRAGLIEKRGGECKAGATKTNDR